MNSAGAEVTYRARTKSFTRRGGRLPQSLERTWELHRDSYLIEVRRDGGYTTVAPDQLLDLDAIFGRSAEVVIEVGSGAGDQIVSAAAQDPGRDFLAFEVWTPGLAKTVSRAVSAGVTNLRLIEADAAQALERLIAPGTAAQVWTFFPDPWRKARHHKRRLVNPKFADSVARVLSPGGIWRLATDWPDYAWQMRDVITTHPQLHNPYAPPAPGPQPHPADPGLITAPGVEPDPLQRGGFAPRWEGRILTRFEERGRAAGRPIFDLQAQRR